MVGLLQAGDGCQLLIMVPEGLAVEADCAFMRIGHAVVTDLLDVGDDGVHVVRDPRDDIWWSAPKRSHVLCELLLVACRMLPAVHTIIALSSRPWLCQHVFASSFGDYGNGILMVYNQQSWK